MGPTHLVQVISGEVPLEQIIVHGRAGALTVFTPLLPEDEPPLVIPADPPHGPCAHDLTRGYGVIGEKPVAEPGIRHMRGEQGVNPVSLSQPAGGDLLLPPTAIGLAGELQDPQGHRAGIPSAANSLTSG